MGDAVPGLVNLGGQAEVPGEVHHPLPRLKGLRGDLHGKPVGKGEEDHLRPLQDLLLGGEEPSVPKLGPGGLQGPSLVLAAGKPHELHLGVGLEEPQKLRPPVPRGPQDPHPYHGTSKKASGKARGETLSPGLTQICSR